MKLSRYQISKIEKKIDLGSNKMVVMIGVGGGDATVPLIEKISNIYCVNDKYEIIWQVNEINTNPPFKNDLFVYLDKNEITADRFSGFEYRIDPETGEAKQIGFHK
jgi:hypothetical protein